MPTIRWMIALRRIDGPFPARWGVLALCVGAISVPTQAQPTAWPSGPESQVNTYTTLGQVRPAVAAHADGSFVVVWQGDGADDANVKSALAQRFDSAGQAVGGELRTSFSTIGDNLDPDVATGPGGEFVVVWTGPGYIGDLTLGRRFSSAGSPLGTLFTLSSHSGATAGPPSVARLPSGGFVVAWSDNFGSPGGNQEVFTRLLDSSGNPLSSPFQVNGYVTGDQTRPRIAVRDAGDFVVVWESTQAMNTLYPAVMGRRFDSTGAPVADEMIIASSGDGPSHEPDVAAFDDGFMIVWVGPVFIGEGILGGRMDPAGMPIGSSFLVTGTVSDARRPRVAVEDDLVMMTWEETTVSSDLNEIEVEAFELDGAFGVLKPSQQLNVTTAGDQRAPAVASTGAGRFVVAWESQNSAGTDTDLASIQRRFVEAAFFADGFETGNTNAWTDTQP